MSNDAHKLNFGGTPSTTQSPGSSLFGTSKPAGSSLFGGGSTPQTTGSSLFGAGDAGKSAGSGFSFAGFGLANTGENKASNGATADNKSGTGFGGFNTASNPPSFAGLGGSQTPPKPSLNAGSRPRPGPGDGKGFFGNASTGGSNSSAPLGSTTPAPSGFPFNPTTTPAGPPPTNLFGGSAGGNNLFGNKDKSAANPFQPAGAPSTTGPPQTATSGGGLFGGDKAEQPLSTFSWAKPAEISQGTPSASTTGAEPQKPLFGRLGQDASNTPSSNTPSTEAQKPLFGGLGQNASKTPSSSAPSSFFQQPASAGGPDKSNKGFQFPSTTTTTTAATRSDAEKSKPLFGGPSSQTPATSAPTFGNLFSNPSTTTSSAPSANLFNLGGNIPATSGSQTPAISTAPPATINAPSSSLFKVPDKPASATTTTSPSKPAPTSTAAPAPSSTTAAPPTSLGASTIGPSPPTASRLRNKTMDEILTRWATDLTKYTSEFQSHAETIAHWDQILVENMAKISKLYISAVTAEKQTASVEMQLSAVEAQQNELESWLAKYEGEVEEMLGKDGVGRGQVMELGMGSGPDQERERTYRLAEKLAERLEDMGRDLGGMVEEVNKANAGLSSRGMRADEPITQIVRILNSHLSQLQAIDQGTVALQAKVHAAQRTSQGLGFPAINGSNGAPGSGAVDDFYRSYMGRR